MNKFERSPVDIKVAKDIGIPIDELSADVLEKWQLAEIRKLLSYIDRSRFYHERLAGTDPESIRTIDDFKRLPITSEADLAGNENAFLCLSPGNVDRMVTVPTTGTTGGSKRLAFTLEDIRKSMEFITVAYTTFMQKGDRMIVMMSGGTQGSIGDVVKHSMDQLGAGTYIYGPITDIRDAYVKLCEWKPDVITGIPVQIAALARYCELQKMAADAEQPVIREVLLSADDVPNAICERIRRVWGARVFRHFGMTELCIFGGCECTADMGYHLRHSDHYFEILDPDEDGFGELAVTTFHHEAMPLLRYRTGDIAKIDRSVCKCGSPFPRLIGPKGRLSNSRDFGNGRVFLRDIEEVIFSDPAVIDFECLAGKNSLHILLKHLPDDLPDADSIKTDLAKKGGLRGVEISIADETAEGFAPVYNSKKRLSSRCEK